MAALPVTNPTLADWAKVQDPDGSPAAVAEVLNQTNEILDDATMLPGNLPTGHRTTIRTGLPTVYWRSFNEGIYPSKSTTAQVDETMGLLEARSEIDIELAALNGNSQEFLLSESRPFLEAMNQEMATKLFYGNPASDPKTFLGFGPRYSATTGAGNSSNVLDGSGTTSGGVTSVWLTVWGPETTFCTFPKGSMAGLSHRNLGEQTVYDVNGVAGTRMQALVNLYTWRHGLVSKDWRYTVRIANLEVAELFGAGSLAGDQLPTGAGSYANVLHQLAQAVYLIPSFGMGRAAIYLNRTVHSGLSRIAMVMQNGVLKIEEGLNTFGNPRRYLSFMGIPLRLCDSLINTEPTI